MQNLNCVLLSLALLVATFDLVSCKVYYIVPSQSSSCSVDSCLTLSLFADNSTSYIDTNTTLLITGGYHDLDAGISVLNVLEFSLLSMNDTDSSPVITCSELANIFFFNVSHIYISGLTFIGCGGSRVESVDQLIIKRSSFWGQSNSETPLTIVESHANMIETSFLSNARGTYRNNVRYLRTTLNYPESLNTSIEVGGALIVSHSTLDVDNCWFGGNRANVGGAIFSELESTIIINDSEFTSNQAIGCDDGLCFGGALFVDGSGTVMIHNSIFQNNTSDQDGGMAVMFNATLLPSQSYAYNNTATRYGGAVAIFQSRSIAIEATMFNFNRASLDGGAVYLYGSSTVVRDCDFSYNTADRMGGVFALNAVSFITLCSSYLTFSSSGSSGGVVSTQQNSTALIESSNLLHNSASQSGGVVYAKDYSNVTMHSSTFVNNSVSNNGGVLFTCMESSVLISSSTFYDNTAASGGVIYATINSNTTVSNSSFANNEADPDGGVVYLNRNSIVTINESTFDHNKAQREGGVISAHRWSSAIISSSSFNNNVANIYGGVAQIRLAYVLVSDSTFDDNFAGDEGGVFGGYSTCNIEAYGSTFVNNVANSNGGVLSNRLGCNFSTEESVFINNSAKGVGSVFFAVGQTHITIHNCNLTQNSADCGGVLAGQRDSTVTIDGSIFSNNSADTDGGTLYLRTQCTITINNSFFVNNSVINDGTIVISDNSIMMLGGSTFSSNRAGNDGGVAFVYDNSTIIIDSCYFISNRAGDGGALYGRRHSTLIISNSVVYESSAQNLGGAVNIEQDSSVNIEGSNFTNNIADYGGAVRVYVRSTANITNCNFSENRGRIAGGVFAAYKSGTITIQTSNFTFNVAPSGGVFIVNDNSGTFEDNRGLNTTVDLLQVSTVSVSGSTFRYNTAEYGGVVYAQGGNVTIETSSLDHNYVRYNGGTILAGSHSSVNVHTGNFSNNTAGGGGGVMSLVSGSNTTVDNCDFTSNKAHSRGGVLSLLQSNASIYNSAFSSSRAEVSGGAITAETSSFVTVGNSSFTLNNATNKGGVVNAYSGSSLVILFSKFINNMANTSGGALNVEKSSTSTVIYSIFQQNRAGGSGGAILASSLSKVNILRSNFSYCTAEMGAALMTEQGSSISFDDFLSNKSQVLANNKIQIHNNIAVSEDGIYLDESDPSYRMATYIHHNQARTSGGGVHAVDSFIIIRSSVKFVSNQATFGGGVSLANSKLYDMADEDMVSDINLILNQADFGGALYVDDKSDSDVCSSNPYTGVYPDVSGCFFQNVTDDLLINFNDNYATSRGHNLFGGLLDRCTVVIGTNPSRSDPIGTGRFKEISNITSYDTVSSEPVRVCLCKNDVEPDCSQQTYSIQVKLRDGFSVPIAAVDQVNQTVTATIQTRFKDITLAESQTVRRVDATCSNLEYQVTFPSAPNVYELTIYAEGPCSDKGISNFNVSIHVVDCLCPLGIMPADRNTECVCVCDERFETFSKYVQECDSTTQSVIRTGKFWITYFNDSDNDNSSPYFIYPYCPLDYCQPPSKSIPVNLNLHNGSDAQCANNRGRILCGSCQPNYSLSLGSSKCIKCPNNWLGLLVGIVIAAFIAGITIVVLLLMFNLTVAVGTLNSIIFYANIIDANRSAYFSQSDLKFASVFISWLNLNIGFDTCFFEGMDVYAKTWLRLAFPLYIIFLVVAIIWISSCSSKFANLIGKRNPVATLATLILLSYTNLLETIIVSFSFINLRYPNGKTATHWLPDANMEYRDGKHIALILVANFILIFGLVYTILIFSWQWLLQCSRTKFFTWTRNQKLHNFIDTYHAPHTAKHRYWTGLLLLVRVVVYLISAFTVSIDPRITLLSTVVILCSLLLYKTVWIIRIYKSWLLNAMESFVYFNIATFAVVTLYTFDEFGNRNQETIEIIQTIATYVSVGTVFILFLTVIVFHMYRYGNAKLYSLVQSTKLCKLLSSGQMSHDLHHCTPSAEESKFFGVIDSRRVGYSPPLLQPHQGPTSSTVLSLTNCEMPAKSMSSNPLENHQIAHGNAREGDRAKPRAKSEAPKSRSIMMTKFEVTRKTEPITIYTETSNEYIMKPLLEED